MYGACSSGASSAGVADLHSCKKIVRDPRKVASSEAIVILILISLFRFGM